MSAHSVNRATIAGLGTTAALLAAVIAVSLVVGGLVAYTGSPSGPFVTREPRLALPAGTADATPRAARTRAPLVVPA
ncbi:MAG: hypothetical protein JWP18_1875, partial [Solirubrobacterales bacterium]|nr:hypothetical protein [Solirubrobacterales bacterium]